MMAGILGFAMRARLDLVWLDVHILGENKTVLPVQSCAGCLTLTRGAIIVLWKQQNLFIIFRVGWVLFLSVVKLPGFVVVIFAGGVVSHLFVKRAL